MKEKKPVSKKLIIVLVVVVALFLLLVVGINALPEPTETTAPQTTVGETVPQRKDASSHIYDNATIIDQMNGFRNKKLGEYSVIKISSDEVTEEALADWYFNYIKKTDYKSYMISYTDIPGKGVYGTETMVEKDVEIEVDENGDYWYAGNVGSTIYCPTDDGKLKILDIPEDESTE